MTTETSRPADAENLAVDSAERQRRRDQKTVDEFSERVTRQGIAHTIGWNATDAIVAEARLEVADRFIEFWLDDEKTEDEAFEYLAYRVDSVNGQLKYFDPTSHSTSASSTYVGFATFKAQQAVVEFASDLLEVRNEWV